MTERIAEVQHVVEPRHWLFPESWMTPNLEQTVNGLGDKLADLNHALGGSVSRYNTEDAKSYAHQQTTYLANVLITECCQHDFHL